MSEVSTPATSADTKACKMCGEPIKSTARLCIHCDSYQDWRSEMAVGNTVLTLLVALGSVLAIAIPVIVKAFTPENSLLSFSYQGASENAVSLLATNRGIRPGTIQPTIILDTPDHMFMWLKITGVGDRRTHIVTAGTRLLSRWSREGQFKRHL